MSCVAEKNRLRTHCSRQLQRVKEHRSHRSELVPWRSLSGRTRRRLPLNCYPTTTAQEAYEIGLEAHVYFYPLVIMDLTRRQLTSIDAAKMPGRGPMNSFSHIRAFPSASFIPTYAQVLDQNRLDAMKKLEGLKKIGNWQSRGC